jgi:peroxiredoxin
MIRRLLLMMVVGLPALAGCGRGDKTSAARETPSPEAVADTAQVKLGPGMPFPSVPLLTLDGDSVDSRALVVGRASLVLFIDPDCEACREFLAVWKGRRRALPPDLNVIGIVREAPGYAKDYATNTGFPFPLYCDEQKIFADKYVIRVTPSVVGTYPDGVVAYVGKAVTTKFTPRRAVDLLEKLRKGKEASGGPAGG